MPPVVGGPHAGDRQPGPTGRGGKSPTSSASLATPPGSARTLTNCLDSGSARVDKIGHLCSERGRELCPFPSEELRHVEPAYCVEP